MEAYLRPAERSRRQCGSRDHTKNSSRVVAGVQEEPIPPHRPGDGLRVLMSISNAERISRGRRVDNV